ncbi:MAG: cobalamin-dependent protein [Treponema sp.]|nr:cobalamin-dependent protein [Treponema sp.]
MIDKNNIKIVLVAIYSEKFAMIGESHGISVIAGELISKKIVKTENLLVVDMYAYDQNVPKEDIFSEIIRFNPNMIGFSCPYGSYDYLKDIYSKKKFSDIVPKPLIVFGGALPTYIPEKYLIEIDNTAVAIRGEGEEAICALVESLITTKELSSINNISFYKSGTIIHNKRKQVNLKNVALPYRNHIPNLLKVNAQIFVENSRGCAWGKCYFCSRDIYLDDYKSTKYRRFPLKRLEQDLINLANYSVTTITFADEDFCGSGLDEMHDIVTIFKNLQKIGIEFIFDVSMNVNSIYSNSWTDSQKITAKDLLSILKVLGLRKVFLGVESGTAEQLKRYNKQHHPNEAVMAINLLRDLKIQIEIGYILFDPLCTIPEIEDNIKYLLDNNLSEITSSLGSGLELRLHFATQYVMLLDHYYNKIGNKLYDNCFDNDTLNYPTYYADEKISKICYFIREANKTIRPLYYPLKSISRYGEVGALGSYSKDIKNIIMSIRKLYIHHIKECVALFSNGGLNILIQDTLENLEISIINLYNQNKELLSKMVAETQNIVLLTAVNEFEIYLAMKYGKTLVCRQYGGECK